MRLLQTGTLGVTAALIACAVVFTAEEMKKQVGNLLAQGRCDDAVHAAFATGDLAFARQVRAFCTNTPG
jgi:hypothetical protein